MSSVTSLSFVQQCFTRYGMPTYVTLGNIGLLFNIAIFIQPAYRQKSCSLYILATSIGSFIGLNISSIPVIYALDHLNSLNYFLFYCEIQFYLRHAFNQLMRTFFVITCADRYASCSNRASIRSFSQSKIAIRIIPSVVLFWLIVAVFPTMLRTLINGVCDARNGVYSIIYSIYILMALGIFPLVSMAIFGTLMIINLKQMRGRIQPTTTTGANVNVLRKQDRDMIRMLIIELIIYFLTTIPNTVQHIYITATQTVVKSKDRQQIETFIVYIAHIFLLYMNNSLSFWIYISTSRSFRLEVKSLIMKWYGFITDK